MKYIFCVIALLQSASSLWSCSEPQIYQLPSEWVIKSNLLAVDLDDYLYECPGMLAHANQYLLSLSSLDVFISDSLRAFSKTKNAPKNIQDQYNFKIAQAFLNKDAHAFQKYRELRAMISTGYMMSLDESSSEWYSHGLED
ncbi:MAG: hypothetical protein AMXMBFR12_01680 [Candidatus Babeliales bacterium]